MAFFGCLRCGEITGTFNPRRHLTIKDIKLSKQVLEVVIKHSKTDQTGKGSKVIIGPGNHRLCPLKLLQKFLQYCKQAPWSDALFRFHNASLLTRAKLQRTLQEALQTLLTSMGHTFSGLDLPQLRPRPGFPWTSSKRWVGGSASATANIIIRAPHNALFSCWVHE